MACIHVLHCCADSSPSPFTTTGDPFCHHGRSIVHLICCHETRPTPGHLADAGRRRHLLTWSHSSSTSVGNLCRASTAHLHPPLLRSCPLYLGPVVSPSVCLVSSVICGDVPYERKASVITVRHFGTRAPGARFFKLPTFKI
jgi:hypothetical protein